MKTLSRLAVAALVVVTGTVIARDASEKTVVEIAAADPNFSTLVELVKTAGLADTLSGEGPFTVFAPTNDAFKKLGDDTLNAVKNDKEKLTKILKAHVISGKVMAADAKALDGKNATTLGGDLPVKVTGDNLMIGKATVTKADIAAKNGVIHVIDTVIVPE